jgi:hypothetical protein
VLAGHARAGGVERGEHRRGVYRTQDEGATGPQPALCGGFVRLAPPEVKDHATVTSCIGVSSAVPSSDPIRYAPAGSRTISPGIGGGATFSVAGACAAEGCFFPAPASPPTAHPTPAASTAPVHPSTVRCLFAMLALYADGRRGLRYLFSLARAPRAPDSRRPVPVAGQSSGSASLFKPTLHTG